MEIASQEYEKEYEKEKERKEKQAEDNAVELALTGKQVVTGNFKKMRKKWSLSILWRNRPPKDQIETLQKGFQVQPRYACSIAYSVWIQRLFVSQQTSVLYRVKICWYWFCEAGTAGNPTVKETPSVVGI
jgi:hypothetical protein